MITLDISRFPFPVEEGYFILSRASSGILNGGFYGNLQWLGALGVVATLVFTFLSIRRNKKQYKAYRYKLRNENGKKKNQKWESFLNFLYWASFVATFLSIIFVVISFASPTLFFADIHLWTFLTQAFQGFCMFLNNPTKWWRLLFLIVPAVFFQKLFINILNNHPWYYQGTNVASGSYYTMMGVKIPRLFNGNMYIRLVMSILSLIILLFSNTEKRKPQKNEQNTINKKKSFHKRLD